MNIKSELVGVDALMKELKLQENKVNQMISKAVNDRGNAVQTYARKNHRWGKPYSKNYTPTGQLERSVSFEYSRKRTTHFAKFFLNDAILETESGKSYGVFIHEGTYKGYKQSEIAPAYPHKSKSKGWRADPFLWRAIDRQWIKKIDKIMRGIAIKNAKEFQTNIRSRVG